MAAITPVTWTTATLASHIRGLLDKDPDAAGGTVPARITNLVIEAGQDLWNNTDWKFRSRSGTLTITAGASTATLPSDFYEFSQRWFAEANENALPFKIIEDAGQWQLDQQLSFSSADTGAPTIAVAVQNTAETATWKWYVKFAPIADQSYSFPFWYTAVDPWTSGTVDADTETPLWPPSFHTGWRLYAEAKALEPYAENEDRKKRAWTVFYKWYEKQLEENNETITVKKERIRGGYDDFGLLASRNIPWDSRWLR